MPGLCCFAQAVSSCKWGLLSSCGAQASRCGNFSCSLVTKSCPTLATPWVVACQTPLSMWFHSVWLLCVHVASLILETHTSVHRHSHTLCNVYIKSYWTPSRATVTHEDPETDPMISGWAPFQTYLLPGPDWNGSTWISQVKAGIAQWEPKHMSQDTANLMVCTDPKEKWRKKALTSLTQWLPSCKAPEFQGKYYSQV